MERYKDRNNSIKAHIEDLDNCHCTIREITSPTSAIAYAADSEGVVDYNDIRAHITWINTPAKSIIHWEIRSLGVEFSKVFDALATDPEIDAVITDGFAKMDEAHKTNTEE